MSMLYLPEDADYQGGQFFPNLLLFGRVCKALGLEVTTERMIDAAQALHWINIGRRQDVYDALRAIIVTHQRDLPLFEEAFNTFWRRPNDGWTTLDLQSLGEQRRQRKTQFIPPPDATPDGDVDGRNPSAIDPKLILLVPTFSQQEVLRHKDFAEMTGEEITQAREMMSRMRWGLGYRLSRRYVAGRGDMLDMRRVYRRNMGYGGELVEFPSRIRKVKPRRLVLLCDISGSMERYTRLLLHFMHTLAQSTSQVESFVFATRLTRITRPLRHKSIDRTLREVGSTVKDWGGGTRIGDAIHHFNYRWSRRVLGHGAVVLIITDGWDRGEPGLLRNEMARLQRNAFRLIWLNPLLGAPQYEPLTRGAQSILPFVDDFRPVQNLANLEALARTLSDVDWHRPERGTVSRQAQWRAL